MILIVSPLLCFVYLYINMSALVWAPQFRRPPLTRSDVHVKLALDIELFVSESFRHVSPCHRKPWHNGWHNRSAVCHKLYLYMSVLDLQHFCITVIRCFVLSMFVKITGLISSLSSFLPSHSPVHCSPCHCLIHCWPSEEVDRRDTSDTQGFCQLISPMTRMWSLTD